MTLSGTGATGTNAVTVKVCTVNSFPVLRREHRQSR